MSQFDPASTHEWCTIQQSYNLSTKDVENGLQITCYSRISVIKVIKGLDSGIYQCKISLHIAEFPEKVQQNHLRLNILQSENTANENSNYATIIISAILISILLTFLMIGLIFRMTGRQLPWQTTIKDRNSQ